MSRDSGASVRDRRRFLGTVTAMGLAARVGWAAAGRRIDKIGLQLFTVRDAMAQDFDGTLAKIAAIGYRVTAADSASRNTREFRRP